MTTTIYNKVKTKSKQNDSYLFGTNKRRAEGFLLFARKEEFKAVSKNGRGEKVQMEAT